MKYLNIDRLGDLKLAEYFFWKGVWIKMQWQQDAEFLFHLQEDNIDWSSIGSCVANKIPGVTLLSTKQAHAFVCRKFQELHSEEEIPELGFPQTFILPQQYQKYV